jgi:hypothetical protein
VGGARASLSGVGGQHQLVRTVGGARACLSGVGGQVLRRESATKPQAMITGRSDTPAAARSRVIRRREAKEAPAVHVGSRSLTPRVRLLSGTWLTPLPSGTSAVGSRTGNRGGRGRTGRWARIPQPAPAERCDWPAPRTVPTRIPASSSRPTTSNLRRRSTSISTPLAGSPPLSTRAVTADMPAVRNKAWTASAPRSRTLRSSRSGEADPDPDPHGAVAHSPRVPRSRPRR